MDAAVSRSTPEGLDVIKSGEAGDAPAVVLQLGTNDGGTPSLYSENVAAVFKALKRRARGGVAEHRPRPQLLRRGRSHHRRRGRQVPEHDGRRLGDRAVPKDGTWSDGLHLKPAGARAMGKLVTDYLDGWRSATWSPSAKACSAAVDAAVA